MISMVQRNQNNITDIIDNIMERVQQNRYSDLFLNKMGVLRTCLEDLIKDFNFKLEGLVSSILEINRGEMEEIIRIINLIINNSNSNKCIKEVGLVVHKLLSI